MNLYYAHVRFSSEPRTLEADEAKEIMKSEILRQQRELFDGGRMTESYNNYIFRELNRLSDKRDEIIGLYEEAMEINLKNSYACRTRESLLISKLLLIAAERVHEELCTGNSDEISRFDPNHKLNKVFSYIRQHSKEAISLNDLCAVCNFSKQHLIRVFKTEFGMTPKSYILEYKINCAKEMFYSNPHLSVKEVADEMGFEDQHYFSRLFTKVSGSSPRAYIKHLLTFDPAKQ